MREGKRRTEGDGDIERETQIIRCTYCHVMVEDNVQCVQSASRDSSKTSDTITKSTSHNVSVSGYFYSNLLTFVSPFPRIFFIPYMELLFMVCCWMPIKSSPIGMSFPAFLLYKTCKWLMLFDVVADIHDAYILCVYSEHLA